MYTIDEAIALARAHHSAGRPQDAVQLCKQVLQADPNNAEACYLLGQAFHSLAAMDEAIQYLNDAVRLKPDHVDAHYLLSGVLVQLGRLDEAVHSLRRCLELAPRSDRVHNNLGCVLERQGKLEDAETCFRRALALNADYGMARCNLGNVLQKQGRMDEAARCYRQVLESNPDFTDAHFSLAHTLQVQGNFDQAVISYLRVLELEPNHVGALLNIGNVLRELRKPEEAIECCRKILKVNPNDAEAFNNLGNLLQDLGRFDEAVASFREALNWKPDNAEIHSNLGNVLHKQGKLDEAVAYCRRAVELNPAIAEAQYNLGNALRDRGNFEESLDGFHSALKVNPGYTEAHNNLALALLAMGRLEEGWPEYEWREPSMELAKAISRPRWTGSPLEGRTILLVGEQGLGDTLQFVRYAKLVKQRGATVVVECQPQLVSLVAGCAGIDRVSAAGQPRTDFDVYCPLLSLPAAFGTSLETIPSEVPYLFPSAEAVARWKGELAGETGFKVGIAWQGSLAHKDDRFRSLPLACFAGLASMPGVRLYSLQMGAGREQLDERVGYESIIDLGDRLGDFYETAAAVSNLDLVITCDSAPAHLAGALGVPVWLALSTASDWRWMLGRSDSPWYPTMRLFRQTTLGDWDGTFRQIQDELARLV